MSGDAEQIDRVFHIVEMKAEVEKLSDGEMVVEGLDDVPLEVEEQFWEHVLAYETAEMVQRRELLARDGVVLVAPEELTDEELALKLIEVIYTLAQHHTYLECTDHLSNRELYTHLWQKTLDEWGPDLPAESGMNCHIDLVGTSSEDDIDIWMRYYADEDTRRQWLTDFPDYDMPAHEDPPYQRDRHLPRPAYED